MKDLKIYIFVASALLIVYLVAQYNRPKPIDWTESFANTDKIPFGTYVLYQQLHDIFPSAQITPYNEPVYDVLSDHGITNASYLIVCKEFSLTEYDYDKLIGFIKKGNDVLIASQSYGPFLSDKLKIETNSGYGFSKGMGKLRFSNPKLDTNKVYQVDKNISSNYFSEIDTAKAMVLGKDSLKHINFVKYNFDKGSLYLNVNPLIFTNYSLLKNDGAPYASMVLSNLKSSDNLIWDQYYSNGNGVEQSPMRVFLRNASLRWAYYIALFSMVIFVLYEVKRRQRIIPVIEPLKNSTLDFVNVVGQVYYEQRDNKNIAAKKAAYFLEHLRTRYHLKTNILNAEFINDLSRKSGVEIPLIQDLVDQVTAIRAGAGVGDHALISLNKNIEQFYIQSGS